MEEINFLKRIVKEAEQISKEDFEVHQKGDKSDLVTNLDLAIEKYLIELLFIKRTFKGRVITKKGISYLHNNY